MLYVLKWFYRWLRIIVQSKAKSITNDCNYALLLLFFSVALLDVFWIFPHNMPWCCFSQEKDCSWERLVWSHDKVVSQRGFFAQSLFTVLARIWLLTSVVLFMKKMFKSLHKVVSQRGYFAQSLVTVFARTWLLTSVALFMKKIV